MRWIGREVKRFLAEADVHVPFLLRVAAAPPDMMADMAAMQNGARRARTLERFFFAAEGGHGLPPPHAHAARARARQTPAS